MADARSAEHQGSSSKSASKVHEFPEAHRVWGPTYQCDWVHPKARKGSPIAYRMLSKMHWQPTRGFATQGRLAATRPRMPPHRSAGTSAASRLESYRVPRAGTEIGSSPIRARLHDKSN